MSRLVSNTFSIPWRWPFKTRVWRKAIPLVLGAMACTSSPAMAQFGQARYQSPVYQSGPVHYDQWGRPICPPCPPGVQPAPNWRPATPRPSTPSETPMAPSPTDPTRPQTPMDTTPMDTTPMDTTPPETTPTTPSPQTDTSQQQMPSPAQDFANDPGTNLAFETAQGGFGGADVAFSGAPNMIGDFFGSGNSTLIFLPPPVLTNVPAFQLQQQTTTTSTTDRVSGMFRLASDPTIQANFVVSPSGFGPAIFSQGSPQPVTFDGVTVANTGAFFSQSAVAGPPFPGSVVLAENGNVTNAVQAAFPNAMIVHIGSAASEDPANPSNIYFIASTYDAITTTTRTEFISVPIPGGRDVLLPQAPIVVTIPSPSASGFVVGRQKIAENSSPIPRDRVFTNYSYFDNTPLASDGVDVHRVTPGFEKTFFDGNASLEMRFPFASTLSTDIIAGGQTSTDDVTFGNINMAFKFLTYKSSTFAWANGLGVTVPTGDDMAVTLPNGFQLLEVKNDSVHLLPFTGFLWVPTDRLFVQGYVQADFDANGNRVYVNNLMGSLVDGGVANDQTFLYADLGVGYWLYQNPCGDGITGFAPTVEVHYNRSLQDSDVIQADRLILGNGADDVQVLDAVVGATTRLGDRAFLTAAYATPIGNGSDQQFDGEARVMFNWFFGGSVNSPFSYGSILP